MHPDFAKLLGLDLVVVFHTQTWPTPVDIPYSPETDTKAPKPAKK
jgi:hypothetical protein